MNFIRLHTAAENNVVIIDVNSISIIEGVIDNNKTTSTVYIETAEINDISVNETPDKIYSILQKTSAKFVKVHGIDTNDVILINVDNISIINCTTNEDGEKETEIFVDSGLVTSIVVHESPEKIYQMIIN